MPTIEVTDEQHDRLDALREDIAAEFVGSYGTVQVQDAVDYLLDHHEAVEAVADGDGGASTVSDGETGIGTTNGDAGAGETDEDTAGDGSERAEGGDDDTAADANGDDGGTDDEGSDRLSAMMSLLEDHDEKWRETDADDGNYEVDLPEGEVEVVRTKDDVRAALFRHY
jgi:hypothetical protein